MKRMPLESGPDFWLKLSRTKPPMIAGQDFDLLVCPASKEKPRAGRTTYRGPRGDVNRLGDDAVVGCCRPGLHPDGTITVLLKSGKVKPVGPSDPLYARALHETFGPPESRK